MREILELGPVPSNEEASQINHAPDFDQVNRLECRIFADQIIRTFAPIHCEIRPKAFNHEFGTYREVCVIFDEMSEQATDEAFNIENNCPSSWDRPSYEELRKAMLAGEYPKEMFHTVYLNQKFAKV